MNNRQIYNLFSYAGMMILSNRLLSTSPEYIEEKTLLFIGKLGRNEFIKFPEILYSHYHNSMLDLLEDNFWKEYCAIWNVNMNNYRLMNVINYLFSVNFDKQSSFFDNFELYFGSMDSVSCEDLRYKVHVVLLEYLDDKIGHSRYLKLKSLENEKSMQ